MSELYDDIRACYNSHKAGDRALHLKPCHSDWCNNCSQSRTDWLRAQTLLLLNQTPTYHHTTILFAPVRTYEQGLKIARNELRKMRDLGIEGVGSIEMGTENNSRAWSAFRQVTGYLESLHKGVVHTHLIMKDKNELLPGLFPAIRQVKQEQMGEGKYTKLSYEQNVNGAINYLRKRHSYNDWWLKEAGKEQLLFKLSSGILYIAYDTKWIKDIYAAVYEDKIVLQSHHMGVAHLPVVDKGWGIECGKSVDNAGDIVRNRRGASVNHRVSVVKVYCKVKYKPIRKPDEMDPQLKAIYACLDKIKATRQLEKETQERLISDPAKKAISLMKHHTKNDMGELFVMPPREELRPT